MGKSIKPAIDLSTKSGRDRANYELIWGDHGFLRSNFKNLHSICDQMWRSNQPSPEHIAEHARERGIKTIINLRGKSPKGYYLLECEACIKQDIRLVDFQVFSRDTPTKETIFSAKNLFQTIEYPALMHCKSGADRAGLMSVLYELLVKNKPIEQALEQLSFKYLHIRYGKTGMLDAFFETYQTFNTQTPMSFLDWVSDHYNPEKVKADFLESWKARMRLDRLVRRE